MTKQKHSEAIKLYNNILKYSTDEIAEKIAYDTELIPSSNNREKSEWVKNVSSDLEKHFEEHTIKNIRMGCYCNENGKLDESKAFISNIYKSSNTFTDFVDKMNEYGAGWYIEDGYLFTKYFSCPCPMLESVDVLPTKTWCYCTIGYNKQIFEYVFDCEVEIELLESIKTGSKQCLMKVITLNKGIIT